MAEKQIIDKLTGIVYDVDTDEQVLQSMILINDQLKSLAQAKDQIRDIIINRDLSGREQDGYKVSISNTQRKTYDKAIMRKVFDADMYDVFMKPDNRAVKTYIKENLESLGSDSTLLTQNMIEEGKPYTTVRIVNLNRG